jgi:hypothetical protein
MQWARSPQCSRCSDNTNHNSPAYQCIYLASCLVTINRAFLNLLYLVDKFNVVQYLSRHHHIFCNNVNWFLVYLMTLFKLHRYVYDLWIMNQKVRKSRPHMSQFSLSIFVEERKSKKPQFRTACLQLCVYRVINCFEYFSSLLLGSLSVRNSLCGWVQFSTATDLWAFDVQTTDALFEQWHPKTGISLCLCVV